MILIADEPAGSLNENNKKRILKLIVHYRETHPDAIIIIATHNLGFQTIADEILVLKFGILNQIINSSDILELNASLIDETKSKQDLILKQQEIKQKIRDLEKLL